MTTFQPGDRIVLDAMPFDPLPIEVGTIGTVLRTSEVDLGDGPHLHVDVKWATNRSLTLVMPPDVAHVVQYAEEVQL